MNSRVLQIIAAEEEEEVEVAAIDTTIEAVTTIVRAAGAEEAEVAADTSKFSLSLILG